MSTPLNDPESLAATLRRLLGALLRQQKLEGETHQKPEAVGQRQHRQEQQPADDGHAQAAAPASVDAQSQASWADRS